MKRTLIAMTLVAASAVISAPAFATGVDVATVTASTTHRPCDGSGVGGRARIWGGSGQVVTAGSETFTRSGFDVQCSANVFLGFQEVSGNLAVVGSGSGKGNQYFGGHTNGGAIAAGGKCTGTNDACGTADVDSAITAALAAGGGGS